jgi:hypothetical protein
MQRHSICGRKATSRKEAVIGGGSSQSAVVVVREGIGASGIVDLLDLAHKIVDVIYFRGIWILFFAQAIEGVV